MSHRRLRHRRYRYVTRHLLTALALCSALGCSQEPLEPIAGRTCGDGSGPKWDLAAITAAGGGIVIESVGEDSALAEAGVESGDVILAWERPANPPANPQAAAGAIHSVTDWQWAGSEHSPRGCMRLHGLRDRQALVFESFVDQWDAKVRPVFSDSQLDAYQRGEAAIRSGDVDRGVEIWTEMISGADADSASELRSWLWMEIGNAWGDAKQFDEAHEALRQSRSASWQPFGQALAWQDLGTLHKQQGNLTLAVEAYRASMEIESGLGDDLVVVARRWSQLAEVAWMQGQPEVAYRYIQQSLEGCERAAPGSMLHAVLLSNTAPIDLDRGELALAERRSLAALRIMQSAAPRDWRAVKILMDLSNVALVKEHFDEAAGYLEQSLEVYAQLDDKRPLEANVWGALARVEMFRENMDDAAKYAARSWEVLNQHDDPDRLQLAAALIRLGQIAWARRDVQEANQHYASALEIFRSIEGDGLRVAGTLNELGFLAIAVGDWAMASERYLHAIEILRSVSPNSLGAAAALEGLGIVETRRGNAMRARGYFREAIDIYERAAPGGGRVANLHCSIGIASMKHDPVQAGDSLNECLRAFSTISEESGDVASALQNLGIWAEYNEGLEAARSYYQRALGLMMQVKPESLHIASTFQRLGDLALQAGRLDEAEDYGQSALVIRQRLAPGSQWEAASLHLLASVQRQRGSRSAAMELYRAALDALEAQLGRFGGGDAVKPAFRAGFRDSYYDLVELELELGQLESAFTTQERFRALGFLEQITERDLAFVDVPADLDEQRSRIGNRYNRIQAKLASYSENDDVDIAERRAELQRLRWEYDDLHEKIVASSPHLRATRAPTPHATREALKTLDAGTVVLSYLVMDEHSYVFAARRGREGTVIQVEKLLIDAASLRRRTEDWVDLIEDARYGDVTAAEASARLVARDLYDALIDPVEALVMAGDRLLVVPDGPLHAIPWGALVRPNPDDAERGWQHLIEWKPIHVALSTTTYSHLLVQRRSPDEEDATLIQLAAFGDPVYSDDETVDFRVRSAMERGLFDGWSRLEHSGREVEQIAELFPPGSTRVFLREQATEEMVEEVASQARILHLATHGYLDEQSPLDSAIVLTLPEPSEDRHNGLLQVWEILERVRLDADLVVLSACGTATGREEFGEGLQSLTRAFHFAGARSVVASLWDVRDRSTAELMVRFHRHLRSGLTKDEALREAQIELIRGPVTIEEDGRLRDWDFSSPFYWAPFQLHGDWR